MSSLFGSDQAYQAMANDFLSLSLTDTDRLFGTSFASVNGQGPLSEGVNYAQLVKTQQIVDGEENNPRVVSDYIQKVNDIKSHTRKMESDLAKSSILSCPDVPSIYDIISKAPQLSEIRRLIDACDYQNVLGSGEKVTFIAPTNDIVQQSLLTWLKVKGFSPYSPPANLSEPVQPYATKFIPSELGLPDWYALRDILKAHTLRYELRPQDIHHRKLELYTAHDGFSVIVDGTGRISHEMCFYQKPVFMLNYQYPLPMDRFRVERIFECSNGVLYVIRGMFSPQITL
jgi:hypothetical protein